MEAFKSKELLHPVFLREIIAGIRDYSPSIWKSYLKALAIDESKFKAFIGQDRIIHQLLPVLYGTVKHTLGNYASAVVQGIEL